LALFAGSERAARHGDLYGHDHVHFVSRAEMALARQSAMTRLLRLTRNDPDYVQYFETPSLFNHQTAMITRKGSDELLFHGASNFTFTTIFTIFLQSITYFFQYLYIDPVTFLPVKHSKTPIKKP
jgi:hypothetical protein